MKKLASIVLSVVLAASFTAFTAFAGEPVTSDYVVCEVTAETQLIDNSETNHQASDHPLQYVEAYGTGRTTQGDAVKFPSVVFEKDVAQVAVKCGYNLSKHPGTATQFWVYLNKIEGEPIAKLEVSDAETASSQIVNQIYKYADVSVPAGTYDVYVVGETEYSGSFSEVAFTYAGSTFSETWKTDVKDYGFVNLTVTAESELIDNSETNHQASDHPLEYAEAYGTGRTTQGDAVKFPAVEFKKDVTQLAVKCGYNLSSKPGTSTQFWVYLDKIEGEPIAKVEVSDAETASSQIINQIHKYADVSIPAGTYDVYVVGETENSGSFSQVNFAYAGVNLEEAMAEKAADDAAIKAAEEAAKAEEEAKKKAEEEAKKAEEEANNAEENEATDNVPSEGEAEAPAEGGMSTIVWVVIAVVVIAVIVIAIAASKKKKKA